MKKYARRESRPGRVSGWRSGLGCPSCKLGFLEPARRDLDVILGDQIYSVQVHGFLCGVCGFHPDRGWGDGTRRGGMTWAVAWLKHSAAFLAANRYCHCGNVATDSHHVVFRSQGGSDDWSNLAALCRTCHQAIHLNGGSDGGL